MNTINSECASDKNNDKLNREVRSRFLKAASRKQDLIEEYIRKLITHYNNDMQRLRKFAVEHHIPIIQHETEKFLSQIIKMNHPKNILEIGTAMGYSALVFAYAMGAGTIDTIEKDDKMIELAKKNIKLAPNDVSINIFEGDAIEQLIFLKEYKSSKYRQMSIIDNVDISNKNADDLLFDLKYDLIFIDAAKGQYMKFLELALPMLKDGGLIISDNIFYGGLVARDRYDVPRRQRTIYARMRNYLEYIMTCKDFDTSLLNIGDGIAMSVYQKEQKESMV